MPLAKHLPAGCAIRRATAADASHVAALLRPVDRAEMEALEGRSAADVLAGSIATVPRVLTIHQEPMMLYGVVACADLPGNAIPWAATTSTIEHDDLITIMWMSRFQVDAWQRRWPTLQAVCDVRNVFHREWLEWLGFTQRGHLDAFGAAGLPFDLYSRAPSRVLH
jgi:hypothetical protein